MLLALQAATVMAQAEDVPRSVFIYSPGETRGLHIAVQENDVWRDAGQLCSSDYGTWGAEKRMYHPSVARAKDGTWRLVFQVNDRAPLFAAAFSRDLVNWRPQDYPIMSTSKCLEPVVFENPDGTFDIYYKSPEGKRWTSATPNFRDFTPDRDSQISDDAWLRDTATVGGQLFEGNSFEIAQKEWTVIENHFRQSGEDWRKSNERMHDDAANPLFSSLHAPVKATLTVDLTHQKPISDKLIGIFFEDISYAADGGLYAELVQNRDFEYTAKDHGGWTATTAWHAARPIEIVTERPLSANNPHYALIGPDTLWNEGWDGIVVEAGKKYDFSMYVLADGQKQDFAVQLVGEDGTILAKARMKTAGADWQQYTTVLLAKKSDAKAKLAVIPLKKDVRVGIDMVSLFPQDTFMGRKNGLRKDLAQVIADLKPKFVRFPGGCMSHGQGLENIYHWNETVGPLQDRKPDFNIWHYHQTRGLGFFEYFQFCEDIGAEPLPVLAAGVPCQNSANNARGIGGQQGGIPMDLMPAYIQELLDLIDWANGDPATSKWAKMRADAGHPAPFNLKYLGLGNEERISPEFSERFRYIYKKVTEKYPEIVIVGTAGPGSHPGNPDLENGWKLADELGMPVIDEHYYEPRDYFLSSRQYNYYPRDRKTKVYLGEYAAKDKKLIDALAEGLYLLHVERNGDVVAMTSYAPLFAKKDATNWNPDLIYFDNERPYLTCSYYVQQMFGQSAGQYFYGDCVQFEGDGKGVIQPQEDVHYGQSVVLNVKTRQLFVKLVNAGDEAKTANINLARFPLKKTATKTVLSGSPTQENNYEAQPIAPQTETVKAQKKFTLDLQPYTMVMLTYDL